MRDLISVIVPVYNVELYLEEAIESVINQTYRNLEIILVDDGSTDRSGDICDEYAKKDRRIKVIHQENKGLSVARNAGIDICTGDMISFLDPDDAFCEDMLDKMHKHMTESGADMVVCDFATYVESGRMDPKKIDRLRIDFKNKRVESGTYSRKEALRMQVEDKIANNAWNKLYRRKLWNEYRYPAGQNYEDVDIILPLIAATDKVYILSEALVMHRKRPGSITDTPSYDNIRDRGIAYKHYTDYIMNHVPEYFDDKDVKVMNDRAYSMLLATYFSCIGAGRQDSEKSIEYIRQEIEKIGNIEDIGNHSFKLKTAAFMYKYLPPELSASAYKIYRPVRLLYRKVMKK